MKKNVWLLIVVMGSTMLLNAAQDKDTNEGNKAGVTMTGVICDSKCVVQGKDQASCNKKCPETSGEYVFLTGQNALQISNPDMVKSFSGKRAKVKCGPSKDKPGMMEVYEIAPPTY